MNFYAIAALVNVATSVILGLLVLSADRKAFLNRIFLLFAASVAVWSYAYFTWQVSVDAQEALLWTHMLMAGAIFIPPTYFHFIIHILRLQRRVAVVSGYVFAATFSLLNWTPYFITDVTARAGFQFWPTAGPLFAPFLIWWIVYAMYPVLLLLRRGAATTVDSTGIRILLAGTVIGYAGGGTNFFLWYGVDVLPFGNISASIYIACVAYVTMRNKLFNMKVLAAELLIFALWLLQFVRLLLDTTVDAQLIDGGLLLVSLIVGTLLIRSVDKEVQQREAIEELSKDKSEFMSFASHEIRNPITAMRGYASLIIDGTTGQVGEATRDAARTIFVTGNQVLMLIAQFLDKSKMELGQIAYAKERFDLGRAVSEVVDGFGPHAAQQHLAIEKRIEYENLCVAADEAKLKEVLGNLIDNSIKYTKEGGITVSVEKRSGMARVLVADTGVGIPKEVLPELFKKFSRADAQKMNLRGTGLGLYLGKHLVEGMGGKLRAESAGEGRGSRFIIELPAA